MKCTLLIVSHVDDKFVRFLICEHVQKLISDPKLWFQISKTFFVDVPGLVEINLSINTKEDNLYDNYPTNAPWLKVKRPLPASLPILVYIQMYSLAMHDIVNIQYFQNAEMWKIMLWLFNQITTILI